jgi:hypothetical protein
MQEPECAATRSNVLAIHQSGIAGCVFSIQVVIHSISTIFNYLFGVAWPVYKQEEAALGDPSATFVEPFLIPEMRS